MIGNEIPNLENTIAKLVDAYGVREVLEQLSKQARKWEQEMPQGTKAVEKRNYRYHAAVATWLEESYKRLDPANWEE